MWYQTSKIGFKIVAADARITKHDDITSTCTSERVMIAFGCQIAIEVAPKEVRSMLMKRIKGKSRKHGLSVREVCLHLL